jgi:hypothetical protein
VLGDRLVELPLISQGSPKVGATLRRVRLEPQRFTELGDRFRQLPLGVEHEAEVVVGVEVVGLAPHCRAILGNGLVQLSRFA